MRSIALSVAICLTVGLASADEPSKNGVQLGGWINRLSSPNDGVRNNATSIIILFGEQAAPATGALTKLLTDSNADVRRHAVTALGAIGPKAKAAADALHESAKTDANPTVRVIAARSLFDVDAGRAKDAVAALSTFLTEHKAGSDRATAIEALGRIGPKAKDAAPQLRVIACGEDKREADTARAALKKIEG